MAGSVVAVVAVAAGSSVFGFAPSVDSLPSVVADFAFLAVSPSVSVAAGGVVAAASLANKKKSK